MGFGEGVGLGLREGEMDATGDGDSVAPTLRVAGEEAPCLEGVALAVAVVSPDATGAHPVPEGEVDPSGQVHLMQGGGG